MNSIETIFEWLLAASLRASVLAVVVLGIQFVLRHRLPAAWRHALWLPMLAVLILPVLPEAPFALFPQKAAAPAPVLTEIAVEPVAPAVNAAPAAPTASTLTMAAELAPALPAAPTPVIQAAPVIEAVPVIQAAPAPTSNVNFLAILWLAGAGAVLGAGWIGYHRNMRRIRATATAPDRILLASIAEAAHEAGLSRVPRTWVSAAVSGPAVTGFLRPLLLLPAGFPAGFNATETRLILLHEFSHLKRLDLPLNWLMCLLQAMHWFNPLLWFAFARMRADRESACDARVLSIDATDRRAEYGGALLKLQCAAPSQALSLGFVGIFEKGSEIKARIREISAHRPGRAAWRLTGASILTLLMVFGVTKGQEAEQDTKSNSLMAQVIPTAEEIKSVSIKFDPPILGKNEFNCVIEDWEAIRSHLLPAKVDQKPESRELLCSVKIMKNDGQAFAVELRKPKRTDDALTAFSIGDTYYRGGDNTRMMAALQKALQEEIKMLTKNYVPTQEDYNKALGGQIKVGSQRRSTLNAQDRNKIPHLKDFLQLYPDSVVRYMALTGAADFPSLSVTTWLHGRYELRMDVPVQYSKDHLKIAGYGEPRCFLLEITSVITRDDGAGGTELGGTSAGSLQKHFGLKEWEALVGSKGDFSVIGCKLRKDNPVPNFDLVIKAQKRSEQEMSKPTPDTSALLEMWKVMASYTPDPRESDEPPTVDSAPVFQGDVQPSKELPEEASDEPPSVDSVPDAKRNSEENAAAKPVEPGLVINILADGTIKIGGGKVDLTQLHEKLASMAAQNKNQPVVIRGDGEVTYKRVVEVIDTCQKAGIWNISFATLKPEPSR